MSHCKNCPLPDKVPGAHLHDDLCRPCRDDSAGRHKDEEEARKVYEADLERTLRDARGKGRPYDCIVCLSGGKDSVYLLYKLKAEYGLKVLAFTTGMNIPEVAWKNMRRTVEKLGVDHVVHTPPKDFYRKFFRYLLQNQNEHGAVRTVCYVCAPLFEGSALELAVEKNIPLVLAGYSPGQPEKERMVYEFSREMIERTNWTPPELRDAGILDESELRRFWNPLRYPKGTKFPRYIAPFHAWPYNQAENMKKVVELGLVEDLKHASPVHSNCPVNWLLMYSDLKNLGYNPYQPEFSKLIREGKAERSYWRVMMPFLNFMIRRKILLGKNVKTSLDWLELKPEQLVIRRAEMETRRTAS